MELQFVLYHTRACLSDDSCQGASLRSLLVRPSQRRAPPRSAFNNHRACDAFCVESSDGLIESQSLVLGLEISFGTCRTISLHTVAQESLYVEDDKFIPQSCVLGLQASVVTGGASMLPMTATGC